MTHINIGSIPLLLVQTQTPDAFSTVSGDLLSSLLTLGKAVVILIVGWIVAGIAKSIIANVLNRTEIDNKIAGWITGGTREEESISLEKWISDLFYWLIILFAVVAFLNTLNSENNQLSLSQTIGNTLYWFIFLLFLPSILSTLDLQGTLVPIQELLNKILAILPNVLAAVLIGATGWLIAQVIRRIVTNLLAATGVDQIGAKFGLSGTAGRQSLSQILGAPVRRKSLAIRLVFQLSP